MSPQAQLSFDRDLAIAPKHVTHVGGKGEYLHDWYAYLEGYSSEFVRSVLSTYLPDAKRIIEPFAGVGTTPLTLAIDGIESFYCEINPAMRRVINTKVKVAALPKSKKEKLSSELIELANNLEAAVKESESDEKLKETYHSAFSKSEFFTTDVFKNILKLRTFNNILTSENPLLGESLQVAVISKLVECSLLKRAGDVRYKTEKELSKGLPDLLSSIKAQLEIMADDCLRCPKSKSTPKLLATNSKKLLNLEPLEADGVITSPPYLNGTNYFRNTKLELWYMGDIVDSKSLRGFRDEVVTSGINDVTKNKGQHVHASVKSVFEDLEENSYDSRISKMVAGYFEEMGYVLGGLSRHLKLNGVACIDIGDSVYGGIHVPTHTILSEIASDYGFKTLDIVTLRERRSRDQTLLSQSLIILKKTTNKTIKKLKPNTPEEVIRKWDIFKETLPHLQHPFTKRNWGNGLHSVCSYQGKMKPALAYKLVEVFSSEEQKVLDPFSGSGTIPFEAALNGRFSAGMDIGLLATSLSNAKLKNPDAKKVKKIIDSLEKHIEKSKPSKQSIKDSEEVRFNKTIPEYFHDDTMREILCARDFFLKKHDPSSPEWAMVMSCMMHILHGNRPYALSRNSHPITPYAPKGDFVYKNVVKHLWDKVNKSLGTDRGENFIDGHCFQADILEEWPSEIAEVDAIITSPPFFDSTKFYMTNWMRYWFCGWSREDFDTQPKSFVEVIQKKSFDAYDFIFQQCFERLKTNGFAVFHLGHSDKCDMAQELEPIAAKYFEVVDIFTESVEHCERHGISDKGSVKGHQYLVLCKR